MRGTSLSLSPSLTVYRIREVLEGDAPEVFDAVVKQEEPPACEKYDYADDLLTARLYVPARERHQDTRWCGWDRGVGCHTW